MGRGQHTTVQYVLEGGGWEHRTQVHEGPERTGRRIPADFQEEEVQGTSPERQEEGGPEEDGRTEARPREDLVQWGMQTGLEGGARMPVGMGQGKSNKKTEDGCQ